MKRVLFSAGLAAIIVNQSSLADEPDQFRTDFLDRKTSWNDVLERAVQEGTVNLHYWGGSDQINIWMDQIAAKGLAEKGIKLNPVRITSTKDSIDLVLAEIAAGKDLGEGSVDAIWVNGENFATLKQQGALFGSFADKLPNSALIEWNENDPRSLLNLRDFGVETNYAEMPWSGEQYVCAVNTDRLDKGDAPNNFAQLEDYLTKNPGKFIYMKPPHYLGNTFVQATIYAHNPDGTGAEPFQKSADELGAAELARLIKPGLDYLKGIEPLLLGGPKGNIRYPEDAATLDGLFRNGEIDFSCKFGLYAVAQQLNDGTYPEGAESFVFPEDYMIKNKNYLAIPSNAPNPASALVLANFMTSVDAQISKLKYTGMPPGIDPWKLTENDAEALEAASPGYHGLTQEELDSNTAPDTNATLVDIIEATWLEYIERKSSENIENIILKAMAKR